MGRMHLVTHRLIPHLQLLALKLAMSSLGKATLFSLGFRYQRPHRAWLAILVYRMCCATRNSLELRLKSYMLSEGLKPANCEQIQGQSGAKLLARHEGLLVKVGETKT